MNNEYKARQFIIFVLLRSYLFLKCDILRINIYFVSLGKLIFARYKIFKRDKFKGL